MKKIALLFVAGVAFISCKQTPKEEQVPGVEQQEEATTTAAESAPAVETTLDLTKIPYTTADIGDFPYLALSRDALRLHSIKTYP